MIICSIIVFALNLYLPFISGKFLDFLVTNTTEDYIKNLAFTIFLIMVASTILNAILKLLNAKLNINCGFEINFDVVEHLKKVDILYLTKFQASYLTQRVNKDSNEISLFVLGNIVSFFTNIGTLFVTLFILFKINPIIAFVLLLIVPVYSILYIAFKEKIYTYNLDFKEKINKYFAKFTSQIQNAKIIKANITFDEYKNNLITSFSSVKKSFYKKII